MSNLKQVGLGLMQYVQDYDEKTPEVSYVSAASPPNGYTWYAGYWFWQQMIYPYVKSSQVYNCPSALVQPKDAQGRDIPYYGNYGGNWQVLQGISIASLNEVATTYAAMDWGGYAASRWDPVVPGASSASYGYLPGSGPGSPIGNAQGTISTAYQSDYDRGRHFQGINIIFADGHVKWTQAEKVYNQTMEMWNGRPSAWGPA